MTNEPVPTDATPTTTAYTTTVVQKPGVFTVGATAPDGDGNPGVVSLRMVCENKNGKFDIDMTFGSREEIDAVVVALTQCAYVAFGHRRLPPHAK